MTLNFEDFKQSVLESVLNEAALPTTEDIAKEASKIISNIVSKKAGEYSIKTARDGKHINFVNFTNDIDDSKIKKVEAELGKYFNTIGKKQAMNTKGAWDLSLAALKDDYGYFIVSLF